MKKFGIFIINLFLLSNTHCTTPVNETRANYNATELLSNIFNTTTLGRANNGLVQFEDALQPIRFNEFEDNFTHDDNFHENPAKFIDDNQILNSEVKFHDIKKKRPKKRKPRQHNYAPQYSGVGPLPNYGQGPINPYFGQYYKPRPEPSFASSALSRVTEALTSIALYDDRQCVARLLCEAAGGNLPTSGVLQSVAGLQPLLTLLSAYNGITTNPLFVFGRAVFLGMSSKGNAASCRSGYPLCPTDTEQLVYYLNNHNGGFFRFFNAPQQGQHNVEQFYNQLAQNGFNQGQNSIQQNYGLYNPNPGNQHYGFQQPNPYAIYNQNYGYGYDYGLNVNNIQKRIQNKPLSQYDDFQDDNSKWTFPNENNYKNNYNNIFIYNSENSYDASFNRKGKDLKFPEQNNRIIDYNYSKNQFTFPKSQNYQPQYYDYGNTDNNLVYNKRYYFNHIENNKNKVYDNLQTVYVVRGNGDPNKPEIVKLRPGESVH